MGLSTFGGVLLARAHNYGPTLGRGMLRRPPTAFPPALTCPYCTARVEAYDAREHRAEARYACGTTTMMLANGVHIEGTRAQRRTMVSRWRRALHEARLEDPLESWLATPEAKEELAEQIARVVGPFRQARIVGAES